MFWCCRTCTAITSTASSDWSAGGAVSIDRLIIPHYDDEARLALIAAVAASTAESDAIVEVNDILRDPAGWFGARGVRSVIAIAPATPDDPPPELPRPDGGPPSGYERLDTGSPDERREAERPGLAVLVRRTEAKSGTYAVVRSGAVLRLEVATIGASPHGTDWLLVPYCQRTLPGAGFAQSRASFAAAVDRILAPHRAADGGLVVHPSRARALIADLTQAFRDYVGPRVSSSTWNVLSMSLFNGPTRPRRFLRCEAGICPRWLEIEDSLISPLSSHDRLVRLMLGPRLASLMWPDISPGFVAESHAAGWLLTGDSVLTGGAKDWSDFYRHLLKSTAVFQVPHHGSRHNFDDRLPLGATTTPFVTCRRGDRHHPHASVKATINTKGLELLSVTTDPDTMLRAITVIRT